MVEKILINIFNWMKINFEFRVNIVFIIIVQFTTQITLKISNIFGSSL